MKKILLILSLVFAAAISAQAQKGTHEVKGTIIGDDGSPIPGAAVMISGTTKGAITDEKGEFKIIAADTDILIFSSLGYEEQQQRVDSRKEIKVILATYKNSLNDVVVIAYGTQTKADLTGAVGVIDTKDIKDETATSIDQMLQGRVAGVDIASNGGDPEGGTTINIRGTRSISASNDPLIVVDGVIDAVENFSDINPEDIKSVTVLKDASSTAIYGSRGANGVVIVTTKGGKGARLTINFTAKAKMSELLRKMDVMDASEFAMYRNDLKRIRGSVKNDTPQSDLSIANGTLYPFENPLAEGTGTDWQDALTRKAISQSYNLSINANESRSNIYLSVGYDNNKGIILGTDSERLSGLLKVNRKMFNWMTLGARVNFTYKSTEKNKIKLNGSDTDAAVCISPLLNESSTWNKYGDTGENGGTAFNNPYVLATMSTNHQDSYYLNLTPWKEINIIPGLKLKSTFTYSANAWLDFQYSPAKLPYAQIRKDGGTAKRAQKLKTNLLSETTLTYKKNIRKTVYVPVVSVLFCQI